MNTERHLDRARVRRAFERAADSYDDTAVVQQRMADELLDRLDVVTISPSRILDAGCGSGYAFRGLMRRFPEAAIVALDFSTPMLARAAAGDPSRIRPVCGDVESLPLADGSVDMVFSNAVLEWCDLDAALDEYLRVLSPGGLLSFATFGPDTLSELAAAWREIDTGVHVHRFVDMHDIGDALVSRRFTIPVMDVDYVKVTHRDLARALNDLRGQGASNAATVRHGGLTGKGKLQKLERVSRSMRNEQGLLESTCEIIYGHAWAPELSSAVGSDPVEVPLRMLRRRR